MAENEKMPEFFTSEEKSGLESKTIFQARPQRDK